MSKILPTIKTKDQLLKFKDDLDNLQEDIYKTDNSFDEYLKSEMDTDTAKALNIELKKADRRTLLEDFEKEIDKALIVKLTVSQQLTSKFVELISSYIKSVVGEAAILEIVVNKRILAGAVVEYGGRVCDSTLNSIFESKRDRVIKVIRGKQNSEK